MHSTSRPGWLWQGVDLNSSMLQALHLVVWRLGPERPTMHSFHLLLSSKVHHTVLFNESGLLMICYIVQIEVIRWHAAASMRILHVSAAVTSGMQRIRHIYFLPIICLFNCFHP